MRRTKRAAKRHDRLMTAVISVLAGIGALTVAAMLLSAFAAVCDLPDSAVGAMSGIALAAGCCGCSFFAANRRRRNGLRFGLICGIVIFAATLAIGALTIGIFSAGGVVSKLLIILSASAIGGIKGVNTRPLF
ncbi:MAG: TIGR04086 family membrane protein [Ruminococcus sp.]|nr:TIGR04086 family membrane protein [Ruminococcus sp.]